MSRQIRQRKGKVTAISRAKRKSEGKGKRKHPEQGTHNQDLAGSPNEDGQRTLCDFGIKTSKSLICW